MATEYPKTLTKESTGESVQVSTVDDEVRAKFNGFRADVDQVDAYDVDDEVVVPPRVTPATVRRFGRDAS